MKPSHNINSSNLKQNDPTSHRAALSIVKRSFRKNFAVYRHAGIFDEAEAWSQVQETYLKSISTFNGKGDIMGHINYRCRITLQNYIAFASTRLLFNQCDDCGNEYEWREHSCYKCGSAERSVLRRESGYEENEHIHHDEETLILSPATRHSILSSNPFNEDDLNVVWKESVETQTNPYHLLLARDKSQQYATHHSAKMLEMLKIIITTGNTAVLS